MSTENKIQWVILIIIIATLIPVWLGAYKSRCETKQTRSRFIEALEGVEEDRKLYYGGTTSTAKPIRMYGGANSCADRDSKDHDSEVCPHCALDQWANEMGFYNMTHEEIIKYIGGGKRVVPVKVEKPGYFARKSLAREYNKSQKKPKVKKVEKPKSKETEEKKVEP